MLTADFPNANQAFLWNLWNLVVTKMKFLDSNQAKRWIGSFCSLLKNHFIADTIPQNSNYFRSWKFYFISSYPRTLPPSSNRWEIKQIPLTHPVFMKYGPIVSSYLIIELGMQYGRKRLHQGHPTTVSSLKHWKHILSYPEYFWISRNAF